MSKLCGKWPTLNPCVGLQLALEVGAERPGEHLDDARGLVDGDDAVQRSGVEHDATERRHRRAGDPTAPTGDGQRDVMRGADPHDGDDLVGRRRPHDRGGSLGHLTGERPVQGEWPPVAAGFGDVRRRRRRPASRRAARPARRAARRRRRATGRAVPVSSMGGVGSVMRPRSCRSGSRPGVRLLGGDQLAVGGDLARRCVGVPAQLAGDQLGDDRRELERPADGRRGGPGCAAAGRRRASWPSRRAPRRSPRPAGTASPGSAARRATGRRRRAPRPRAASVP